MKTQSQAQGLKATGAAVRDAFDAQMAAAVPGITPQVLDDIGGSLSRQYGAPGATRARRDTCDIN